MLCSQQVLFILCGLCAFLMAAPRPDSAGNPPLPGPGLSYGGIPYGSMSGNVAEYFKQRVPSSGRSANVASLSSNHNIDYSPIEQWL